MYTRGLCMYIICVHLKIYSLLSWFFCLALILLGNYEKFKLDLSDDSFYRIENSRLSIFLMQFRVGANVHEKSRYLHTTLTFFQNRLCQTLMLVMWQDKKCILGIIVEKRAAIIVLTFCNPGNR